MDPLQIILGSLLLVAAVVLLIVAFTERGQIVALGAAVILASVGAFLLGRGIVGEHQKFHAKHTAIVHDLVRQGFSVDWGSVSARGGNYLVGTEADIEVGGCLIPFVVRRVDGIWRVGQVAAGGSADGLRLLTRDDVARMADGCPT